MFTQSSTNHTRPNPSEFIFSDEFQSIGIDQDKWNIKETGKTINNEQQAYVDSKETIYTTPQNNNLNGCLVIHPRFRPAIETSEGAKFDFISGRIDTRGKFEFTYGIISARMKLPSGSGLWPAFWLMGKGRWPDCGEIDIMENVGEEGWTSSAVHGPGFSGDNGLANLFHFPDNIDASNWHVYSVNWSSNQLEFLVDERVTYRVTRPMVSYFGKWVFDTPKYIVINLALGGTYPHKNNGVQTPYYGIPEETVQKVKSDKAKFLVDWVTVVQ